MNALATASYVPPEIDEVSVLGFVAAFLTVVFLMYRRDIRTRLPILAGLYAMLAAYGFMAGAWPLGFVLSALTVMECRRSPAATNRRVNFTAVELPRREIPAAICESRLSRLFGP